VGTQHVESAPIAVIRSQVRPADLPRVIPEQCGRVWAALRGQGRRGGRHIAIRWDGAIRLEVGVEAVEEFVETEDVVRSATPAGLVASAVHFGPYGGLSLTHEAIRRWCEMNGHTRAGPHWEIYGHWLPAWNANPALIRTDVFYLLAADRARG
jgi:effector-binding domain-containing protein